MSAQAAAPRWSRLAGCAAALALIGALLSHLALGQPRGRAEAGAQPEAEFHMARLIYRDLYPGFRAFRPWWAIDYPEAEYHFIRGLRRLTRIESSDDSRHLQATDPTLFDDPWLFAQQVGHWSLSDEEAAALREYLMRGGFLVVDDFWGPSEWSIFMESMNRIFPDRPIVELPETADLLHVLYDLDQRTQIPGLRHLRRGPGGTIQVRTQASPPHWRGIFGDRGRLMVAINFNMDMGDGWEEADTPVYPEPMTALAYRFGINYVVYAMTH